MGLVQKQGTCKFCGQYMALEVPESFTEAEVNEEATRKCTCPEAEKAMLIEDIQIEAEANIKGMFKDINEMQTMKDVALSMVKPLSEWKLGKVSLSHGNYQLKMVRKERKISLSLKYTAEAKRE